MTDTKHATDKKRMYPVYDAVDLFQLMCADDKMSASLVHEYAKEISQYIQYFIHVQKAEDIPLSLDVDVTRLLLKKGMYHTALDFVRSVSKLIEVVRSKRKQALEDKLDKFLDQDVIKVFMRCDDENAKEAQETQKP